MISENCNLGKDTEFELYQFYEVHENMNEYRQYRSEDYVYSWYLMKVQKITPNDITARKVKSFDGTYEKHIPVKVVPDWYYGGPYDSLEDFEDKYPEHFI